MSTQEGGDRPDMLGNISTTQRPGQTPMQEGKTTPIRTRPARRGIAVRVTFEENRLAAACLATAYERVVPVRRRNATAHAAGAGRQAEQRLGERAGA